MKKLIRWSVMATLIITQLITSCNKATNPEPIKQAEPSTPPPIAPVSEQKSMILEGLELG